jgi:predicted transposase YdaD
MDDFAELVSSPHDKFFKSMFGCVDVTRDSLGHFLSGQIVAGLNLARLSLRPGTFVDPHLKEQSADLLFSVGFQDSPLFLYLLWEHKSHVDHGICFQLLGCMDRIWADGRRRGEEPAPILASRGFASRCPSWGN